MRRVILTVTILAGFATSQAEAQSGTNCQGRVFIDSVYQTGVGVGAGGLRYDYFFVLRNQTSMRLTADVALTGFPSNVTLFSPTLPGIAMGPNATVSPNTRFGNGTHNDISMRTVRVAYDGAAGSGPTISVSNCRPW